MSRMGTLYIAMQEEREARGESEEDYAEYYESIAHDDGLVSCYDCYKRVLRPHICVEKSQSKEDTTVYEVPF